MSHSKNVEAFGKLVGICTGYGDEYKPVQPNLRTENLSGLLTQARSALTNVSEAKTAFENATNGRAVAFNEMSQLATRIFAALKSSGALPQTVDDARAMVRKIRSRGAVASRTPVPSDLAVEKAQAATQTLSRNRANGGDYDSVGYHFEKLLKTIGSEPLYNPFIAELQVQNLQGKLNSFRSQNDAVVAAGAQLGKVRRDRNALLYTTNGSMYSTAMAVKQIAKAAFGYNSEAARAASHIHLTKNKK
ncbi:MAG: hypothetical protein HYR67_05955 [Bacteroidetes bacterium]|nr:hypothetical protein [Bacteroidota bacterium]